MSSSRLDRLSLALKTCLYSSEGLLWDVQKTGVGLKVKGEARKGRGTPVVLMTFLVCLPTSDKQVLTVTSFLSKVPQMWCPPPTPRQGILVRGAPAYAPALAPSALSTRLHDSPTLAGTGNSLLPSCPLHLPGTPFLPAWHSVTLLFFQAARFTSTTTICMSFFVCLLLFTYYVIS